MLILIVRCVSNGSHSKYPLRHIRLRETDMAGKTTAVSSGLAGGAIAMALIETLFDKQILTFEEARDVLSRALTQVGVYSSSPEGWEAARIIGRLQRGRFSHYR